MGTGSAENSTDAITALLTERRRYEQWLATLESRRAITPAHVYARVHGDYQARLSAVLDQLGGRSTELQASVDSLGSRLVALEGEENSRRDERSEAELRAAVGEYTQEKWEELSDATDSEISRLSAERSETAAELAQLQQLLNMAKSRRPEPLPPALTPPTAAAPQPPAAAPHSGPELVPLPPSAVPRLRPPEARTADGILKRAALAAAAAAERPADRPPPRPEPKTEPPREPPAGQKGEATMFDELEFLKSVIDPRAEANANASPGSAPAPAAGSPPAGPPAAKPATERPRTPMAGVPATLSANAPRAAVAPPPPAPTARKLSTPPEAGTLNDISLRDQGTDATSRGDGSVPVYLRDVPVEQVKSLKCSECGSMNYPTEWYCERCGGELAAM